MKYDITFHPSWWHLHAGVDFTQEFFDDPEYRMECDVKMRRTLYEKFGEFGLGEENPKKRPLLGTDFLAAGYLYSELMGCEIKYQADNSPQVLCRNLDEEQIAEVKAPALDTSVVWQKTQKQIDYLLNKFGYVETFVNLQGILNIAMDIMGQEVFVAFYTGEEEVTRLLEEITKLSLEVGKRFRALSDDVSGGVTAIIRKTRPNTYLTSNCSVEMISNELYEKFLLQFDQKLAQEFKDFGIHHCGATMEHVVPGYAKIPELKFAEVGAGSDMAAVRKALPEVFLNARYSPARLLTASPADIRREVKELIKAGQEEGGNISISCVGIDKNVSDGQIRAFLDACRCVEMEG